MLLSCLGEGYAKRLPGTRRKKETVGCSFPLTFVRLSTGLDGDKKKAGSEDAAFTNQKEAFFYIYFCKIQCFS